MMYQRGDRMRIENEQYNIQIDFIGRAKDGLNVWDGSRDDANSIEIFLGFSVADGFGTCEGMCIPMEDIVELYDGLSSVMEKTQNSFACSKRFPGDDREAEFFTVSSERIGEEISFTLRIFEGLWDYVELTEMMSGRKLSDIVLELKAVIDQYPVI